MDNNWKTMNVKREIFDLYDYARVLFNQLYNGHDNNYTDTEIALLENVIKAIENNIKNIREEIEYYDNVEEL